MWGHMRVEVQSDSTVIEDDEDRCVIESLLFESASLGVLIVVKLYCLYCTS